MSNPNLIYHLTPESWHQSQPKNAPYQSPSLAEEGFIHCTGDRKTLLSVANLFYKGVDEPLLVYEIDTTQVTAEVKFELPAPVPGADPTTTPDGATHFPHIYGPIDRAAIIRHYPLVKNQAGDWTYDQ